jgi:hypothetical protein
MSEVPLYQVMHAAAAADYHMCGTVTDVFIAQLIYIKTVKSIETTSRIV